MHRQGVFSKFVWLCSVMFELKQLPAGRTLMIYAETKDHAFAVTGIFEIPAEPNEVIGLELKREPT